MYTNNFPSFPQVLVPRYQESTKSYTRMLAAPKEFRAPRPSTLWMLELRGNPFPPLAYSNTTPNRNHIHNVLLAEAR